ncbi:MAG TPA: SRPBCC family protein [Candidatus Limnocylindrales bacterium]|nr:SRPBCC family protein [Candidatus Limnocylindrales bacterium]
MIRFAYEESIGASPAEVFAVMSDVTRFADWLAMDGRLVNGSPTRLGSTFESTGKMGPWTVRGRGEVTRFEPERAFGFTMIAPNAFDFELAIELFPTPFGTRLAGSGSMTTHRFWRLLEPLLRSEVPKGEIAEAQRLKAVVEAAR